MCQAKVLAIIVTYNPEIIRLTECIRSLAPQVERIIIVDNGSNNPELIKNIVVNNLEIIFLSENKGIAFAQNHGVKKGLEAKEFDYLFFSDQDTCFPGDVIEKLKSTFAKNNKKGKNVACASPFFKDHRSSYMHPSVSLNMFTSTKVVCSEVDDDLYPSHVIASGMLMSREAWNVVGPFCEKLFIDWVDTEWCWRALANNMIIVQTPSVIISHELGYGQKTFAGRSVTIHNSFRNFYKIRNAIYLMLYSNYSFKYRYHAFFHAVKNVVFEMLYSKEKLNSLKVCFKAVRDGMLNNF